jgi:SynChlorMet cassette radical SAM/SPASM protein ScmF
MSSTQNDQSMAGVPALSTIYFYLSSYCNLSCVHCWISPKYLNASTASEEAPISVLTDIIDQAIPLGLQSIKITGGEPFLSKNIEPLIAHASAKKLKMFIETNATLIDEDKAKFLQENSVSQVCVSLDGPNQKVHERIRNKEGSFGKTTEGITALKKHGMNVQLIMSLCKYNYDYLEETIGLAEKYQVKSFKINCIVNVGRAESMRGAGATLSVADYVRLNKTIEEEIQPKYKVRILFDIPPVFKSLSSIKENKGACGIKNILGVLSDGSISTCGIGEVVSSLKLGNIANAPLREIWEKNDILKKIREDLPSKLQGICGQCIFKGFCLGKCRAEVFYRRKDFISPFYFCDEAFQLGIFPSDRMVE